MEKTVYYPHLSKTIVELLNGMNPPYRTTTGDLKYHVLEGQFVEAGTKIASFGEHVIVAPEFGKIVFLGSHLPGVYEWQFDDLLNLLRPADILDEEYFLFGMRFLRSRRQGHRFPASYPCIFRVFDAGRDWLEEPRFLKPLRHAFISKFCQASRQVHDGIGDYLSGNQQADQDFCDRLAPFSTQFTNVSPFVGDTPSSDK